MAVICLGDGFRRASVNRPPTPDADEDRESEPTLQEIINIKVGNFRLNCVPFCEGVGEYAFVVLLGHDDSFVHVTMFKLVCRNIATFVLTY